MGGKSAPFAVAFTWCGFWYSALPVPRLSRLPPPPQVQTEPSEASAITYSEPATATDEIATLVMPTPAASGIGTLKGVNVVLPAVPSPCTPAVQSSHTQTVPSPLTATLTLEPAAIERTLCPLPSSNLN